MPSSAVNSGQLYANLVERMTAAFLDLLPLFALVLGIECGIAAGLPLPSGPVNRPLGVLSLLAYASLLLGAILPRRQAGHDLIARSMVVRSKAWRDPELRERILEPQKSRERARMGVPRKRRYSPDQPAGRLPWLMRRSGICRVAPAGYHLSRHERSR